MFTDLASSLKINNVLKLSGLILLIAGIIVGVYLVGERVALTPKAEGSPIVVRDSQGNPLPEEGGVPVTDSPNIKIELNAPPAP